MRKVLVIGICAFLLIIGGVGISKAQDNTTDTQQYVGDVLASELTPEQLSEMEGEFIYNPETTNQYTPNIRRQRQFYILELAQEGLIQIKSDDAVLAGATVH